MVAGSSPVHLVLRLDRARLLAAEQQLRPFALALFEISLHLFHMRLFNHRPHLYGGVERVTGL